MKNSIAQEQVAKAVTRIALYHPFFANLLLQMPRIEDPSVSTACTNGVVIKYSPKFVESLNLQETLGLMVHEVMHPALGHLSRLPATKEGNIAGDFAINNFLDNYNKTVKPEFQVVLPKGGLIDHVYDGLSAEEILAIRKQAQENPCKPDPQSGGEGGKGEGKGEGEEGEGEGKPGDPRTQEEGAWGEFEAQAGTPDISETDMEKEWERRLVRAAFATKMEQGTLPSCIEALVHDLINPKIPWQQLLERFVDTTSNHDYSWRKPDRRYQDVIVPDLQDETIGHIVVALDTSGSIFANPEAVNSFEIEVKTLIEKCRPEKVTVIHCDSAIAHVEEFAPGDEIKLVPRGGGGTSFRPVGEYIRRHEINPRICIYLTDLEGSFPETPWDFPTAWCVYNNPGLTAPFGDTVHIPQDN